MGEDGHGDDIVLLVLAEVELGGRKGRAIGGSARERVDRVDRGGGADDGRASLDVVASRVGDTAMGT
jgi:hypothetical protein